MFFSLGASKWVLAAPLPKVLSCWRRTHTYHTNDLDDKCQDEMWKKSLYWTSSTKFYWNIVSLLFDLLKDLSKIIVTLVEGPLLHDLVEGSHPFHPWHSPGLFWWRQGGIHPWKYFFFLWRIDVVILNTMFVKSWLHLYSKVLRWNQHTNSWEKV